MNKTDRLLAIVLELQRRGRQRAEDLASTFETSKRTIYRDIQSLCEAGVPLISTPGQGYALMKGYFLPPLSFTTEEATMLLLGSDYMAQHFDAQYREAALSASRKIESVLPEQLRADVHYLQDSIRFVSPDLQSSAAERSKLQQLRRALIERVTVRFRYFTRYNSSDHDKENTREVDPYGLVYFFNAWHLVAYCHLRQAIRNFRLDRIESLELLSRTFQRSPDFEMRPDYGEQTRKIQVRVLFDHEVARWVREARFFHIVCMEEVSQGLLVTLNVRQEAEILQWLLSWGRHVRVLEPELLRTHLREEAEQMLHIYQHDKISI